MMGKKALTGVFVVVTFTLKIIITVASKIPSVKH